MKPLVKILVSAAGLLVATGTIRAQELLVPAGTLLQCTMDEPNLSSKTTSVGDPVLCHLKTFQEFGKPAFPRGAMLGGHLEGAKEPGHFVGKGYLKITFDRVILPYGDLPVPAKVIQAKGFKVDKKGDIDGKGHAKRDAVEWMFPPLWPWKVVSLPARGPRPTLKGEEPMELRLMDDISVPATLAYGPMKPDRPPYASSAKPSNFTAVKALPASESTRLQLNETTNSSPDNPPATPSRAIILVLKTHETYELARYHINGDVLTFEQADGTKGAVDLNQVDWRKTSEMTSQLRVRTVPEISAHVN
jgi:hypothetical protein